MKKTITICGSMHFFREIQDLQSSLESMNFIVHTPLQEGLGADYSKLDIAQQAETKNAFIETHIQKIKQSDAVLIANYSKNDQENYIGANSFLEMGFSYILGKKIFVLNNLPDKQNNFTEILGLKPFVLAGELSKIQI